jgi:hypothetical protein
MTNLPADIVARLDAMKAIEALTSAELDTAMQAGTDIVQLYEGREDELAIAAISVAARLVIRFRFLREKYRRDGVLQDDDTDDLAAIRAYDLGKIDEHIEQDHENEEPAGFSLGGSLAVPVADYKARVDAMTLIEAALDESNSHDDHRQAVDLILRPYVMENRLMDIVASLITVASIIMARLIALRDGIVPDNDTNDYEAIWSAVKHSSLEE